MHSAAVTHATSTRPQKYTNDEELTQSVFFSLEVKVREGVAVGRREAGTWSKKRGGLFAGRWQSPAARSTHAANHDMPLSAQSLTPVIP